MIAGTYIALRSPDDQRVAVARKKAARIFMRPGPHVGILQRDLAPLRELSREHRALARLSRARDGHHGVAAQVFAQQSCSDARPIGRRSRDWGIAAIGLLCHFKILL
jgi:hypothetical protein